MASIGFRWLDILEKEFDKAFVDLDLTIGKFFIRSAAFALVRTPYCLKTPTAVQLKTRQELIYWTLRISAGVSTPAKCDLTLKLC